MGSFPKGGAIPIGVPGNSLNSGPLGLDIPAELMAHRQPTPRPGHVTPPAEIRPY